MYKRYVQLCMEETMGLSHELYIFFVMSYLFCTMTTFDDGSYSTATPQNCRFCTHMLGLYNEYTLLFTIGVSLGGEL